MKNEFVINEAERLQLLLKTLNINAKRFSNELGYLNPGSIYLILSGRNKLSGNNMINRILEKFPTVSYLFLKTGKLPVLIESEAKQNVQKFVLNDLNTDSEETLMEILKDIREQNKLILEKLKQINLT